MWYLRIQSPDSSEWRSIALHKEPNLDAKEYLGRVASSLNGWQIRLEYEDLSFWQDFDLMSFAVGFMSALSFLVVIALLW